jgi:two-component system response regulator LytT
MDILIIEDETPAAKQLERLIARLDKPYRILGHVQSVSESVNWLKNHDAPDLIFMDIQLSDDLSFSIFSQVNVKSPGDLHYGLR